VLIIAVIENPQDINNASLFNVCVLLPDGRIAWGYLSDFKLTATSPDHHTYEHGDAAAPA
jgi:hypothetical protein